MVYPPDTLNRFIPSGGINSYIPPDSLRTDTLFRDTGQTFETVDPLFETVDPLFETVDLQ